MAEERGRVSPMEADRNCFGESDTYQERPSETERFSTTRVVPQARIQPDPEREITPGNQTGNQTGGRNLGGQVFGEDEEVPPRRRRRGEGLWQELRYRLPPLWGVDLVIILASLAEIIRIWLNFDAVIYSIFRVICALISVLPWLLLLAGVLLFLMYRTRRYHRW